MNFGPQVILEDGTCLAVGGALFDEEFFRNLNKTKTPEGFVFHRGSELVEFFPSEMRLKVSIIDMPCHQRKDHGLNAIDLSPEYLGSLRFTAFWKKELEMRPAEALFSMTLSKEERRSVLFPLFPGIPEFYTLWMFEFRIRTQTVPVSDHFILVIESPEKKRLARLSARLGN
jgi:hypothetical protein